MSGEDYPGKKFEFPECWNNDIRMNALFAPLRPKSVNPIDRDSKLTFWTNLIENWCKFNKCPLIDVSELKNTFSRKDAVPACLDEVVLHLINTGVLIHRDAFMNSDNSWKSWMLKVLIRWTVHRIKNALIDNQVVEAYYVHLPVVKYLSEELQKIIVKNSQGKIVCLTDFQKWGFENAENLSVVLHWMEKQGLVAISNEHGVPLVKLSRNEVNPVTITEIDLGIYNLEKQVKLLEGNISKLETEKTAALEETRKHLGAKMKNLAKISLRRKIELEKTIEKRAIALENIRSILYKIEQAKLDSEVLDCYQSGIAILKQMFGGINADVVTGTMNELQEVLNNRNEIEEALARPMDPELEENLEEELNELLLEDAPEVPTHEIPKSTKENKNEEVDEVKTQLQALSI